MYLIKGIPNKIPKIAGKVEAICGMDKLTTSKMHPDIQIPMKRTNGTTASPIILTIESPVVANYDYTHIKSGVTISGEINNPSNQTARNVIVVFTARNASGGAMDQGSKTLGKLADVNPSAATPN